MEEEVGESCNSALIAAGGNFIGKRVEPAMIYLIEFRLNLIVGQTIFPMEGEFSNHPHPFSPKGLALNMPLLT